MNSANASRLPRKDPDELLRSLPLLQRAALASCLVQARRDGFFSVAVHGSLSQGDADEFSDLDLILVHDASCARAAVSHRLDEIVNAIGSRLLEFDASHIGSANGLIFYLSTADTIVKLDISIWSEDEALLLPAKTCVVCDERNRFGRARIPLQDALDESVLFRKLIAWLWFCHVRIARGEFFAAARAVDYSREHALLPIILSRLALPNDGHRRLETRLPAPELDALRETYPHALEKRELVRALTMLALLIQSELTERRPRDAELASALEAVIARISAAERYFSRYWRRASMERYEKGASHH